MKNTRLYIETFAQKMISLSGTNSRRFKGRSMGVPKAGTLREIAFVQRPHLKGSHKLTKGKLTLKVAFLVRAAHTPEHNHKGKNGSRRTNHK